MGGHVQSVGDERDRAEQQAADDFGHHHEAAERDHHPGAPLVRLMTRAEEDVGMGRRGDVVHAHGASALCGAVAEIVGIRRLTRISQAAYDQVKVRSTPSRLKSTGVRLEEPASGLIGGSLRPLLRG